MAELIGGALIVMTALVGVLVLVVKRSKAKEEATQRELKRAADRAEQAEKINQSIRDHDFVNSVRDKYERKG